MIPALCSGSSTRAVCVPPGTFLRQITLGSSSSVLLSRSNASVTSSFSVHSSMSLTSSSAFRLATLTPTPVALVTSFATALTVSPFPRISSRIPPLLVDRILVILLLIVSWSVPVLMRATISWIVFGPGSTMSVAGRLFINLLVFLCSVFGPVLSSGSQLLFFGPLFSNSLTVPFVTRVCFIFFPGSF